MKTIKTLLLAVLIVFSSQVSANTVNPINHLKLITADTSNHLNDLELISQQIQALLKDSEITIYDELIVKVKIKLNSNNKIIEVSNDSKNKEISKFLNKKLRLKEVLINKKSNYRFYVIPVKFLSTVY